MNDKMKAEIQ